MNKVTSASLGYPLSVFNKNSTLKIILFCQNLEIGRTKYICECPMVRTASKNYDDDTYTDIVDTTLVRYHTRLAVCTCGACFATT